jgi:hypothetical protein
LKVHQQHIRDIGPLNAAGVPAYAYVYTLYRFVDRGRVLLTRRYVDQADCASFLGWRVDGQDRGLTEADLDDALLLRAMTQLQALGVRQFRWLDRAAATYREVDPSAPGAG